MFSCGKISPQVVCPSGPCFSSGIGDFLRGFGFAMTALAGMGLSTEGNGAVELFNGVEASLCTRLSSYSLAVLGNFGGSSFGCSD